MREWGKRKTETRAEKTLRVLKSILGRILVFFVETVCGTLLAIFSLAFLLLFTSYLSIMNREISFGEKKELYEAIVSHRSDQELRVCEETLAETHGKIIFSDFREYENCISEIQNRRKDEEAQRKLDSLGIWKRGAGQ